MFDEMDKDPWYIKLKRSLKIRYYVFYCLRIRPIQQKLNTEKMKKFKLILKSIWFPCALLTGMLFTKVVVLHSYHWYTIIPFILLSIYSIWYLYSIFDDFKK